jgi:hypothetical protein
MAINISYIMTGREDFLPSLKLKSAYSSAKIDDKLFA